MPGVHRSAGGAAEMIDEPAGGLGMVSAGHHGGRVVAPTAFRLGDGDDLKGSSPVEVVAGMDDLRGLRTARSAAAVGSGHPAGASSACRAEVQVRVTWAWLRSSSWSRMSHASNEVVAVISATRSAAAAGLRAAISGAKWVAT